MSAGPWQEIGAEGEGQLAHPLRGALQASQDTFRRVLQDGQKVPTCYIAAPHTLVQNCSQGKVG